MDGELTIKGITRPVRLRVDYLGGANDPWGNERVVFRARGKLNREDWGLTWNMVLDTGSLLVSKQIALELEVELIRDRGEHNPTTTAVALSDEAPELIGFTLTHAMLRKELTILSQFRPGVGDDAAFDEHLRLVTDHLLRHDEEEDAFHYRLLRERAPHVRPVLDRLADEHAVVAERLRTVRDHSVLTARRMNALRELADLVVRHIPDRRRRAWVGGCGSDGPSRSETAPARRRRSPEALREGRPPWRARDR